MARTGQTRVYVDAITYKEYTDEEGHKRTERRAAPTLLGSLAGLTVLSDLTFQALYSRIRAVADAYEKAENAGNKLKTSELESLAVTLTDTGRIAIDVGKLEQEERMFFNSELWLLCFVVDDKSERYRTARAVLELAGDIAGKDRAKTWLAEREHELKQSLGCDKIGIQ